jgi:hypothetical protein
LAIETVSCLRPLRRRRRIISRPAGVFIRLRKPWVRLRLLRWGWNVLFTGYLRDWREGAWITPERRKGIHRRTQTVNRPPARDDGGICRALQADSSFLSLSRRWPVIGETRDVPRSHWRRQFHAIRCCRSPILDGGCLVSVCPIAQQPMRCGSAMLRREIHRETRACQIGVRAVPKNCISARVLSDH